MHAEKEMKAGVSAALFALRLMGQRAIRISGYRTRASLRRAGLRGLFRQFSGTIRRVKARENREHLI